MAKRLGKQKPLYKFFLNPHSDARFTRCPKCDAKTKLKKVPLVIHVKPAQIVVLHKTCRYCPACDLLIAHRDELEVLLTKMFPDKQSELIEHDLFVLGTLDRKVWKAGMKTPHSGQDMFDNLHDFKKYLDFEPARYMWVQDE